MGLQERIDADIRSAMLAREKDRLNALRSIKSAILLELTREADAALTEEAGVRILSKLHKQRAEAAAIYHQQGRADLAEEEEVQAKVIEAYLPQRLDEAATEQAVRAIVERIGAASMADMGRTMAAVKAELGAQVDGQLAASVVKRVLAGQ